MRTITNNVQNKRTNVNVNTGQSGSNSVSRPGAMPLNVLSRPINHAQQYQHRPSTASYGVSANVQFVPPQTPQIVKSPTIDKQQQRSPPQRPQTSTNFVNVIRPRSSTNNQNNNQNNLSESSSVRPNANVPQSAQNGKRINVFFNHSSARNFPTITRPQAVPKGVSTSVKQEEINAPESPMPTTAQSSTTTPTSASPMSGTTSPRKIFEKQTIHNLPFMKNSTTTMSRPQHENWLNSEHGNVVGNELISKLRDEIDHQKKRARDLEESTFIEKGKAKIFSDKVDKLNSEKVKLQNECINLKLLLKNREDGDSRKIRGELEKTKMKLQDAERRLEEHKKDMSVLKKTNEELEQQLYEMQQSRYTPNKNKNTSYDNIMAELNDDDLILSPDFDKRLEENSMPLDDFDSMTDSTSLIFDGTSLYQQQLSLRVNQANCASPSIDSVLVEHVPPPQSKPTVPSRTINLSGSANRTFNLVAKLLEDVNIHWAFYTLISQKTMANEKSQTSIMNAAPALDIKEPDNLIIIIDDDDSIESRANNEQMNTSIGKEPQVTLSWLLYDHLHKMLNNKASVVGLIPILQKLLVAECDNVMQCFAQPRVQQQQPDTDILNDELQGTLENSYKVICSIFDVLSLLLLESSELMESVKNACRGQKRLNNIDEKRAQTWRDKGYIMHPLFNNPSIFCKQRPDSTDNTSHRKHTDVDMYSMLLNPDFMLDDYEGHLRLNVRLSPIVPIPSVGPSSDHYAYLWSLDTEKDIVATVIKILREIPQLYSNTDIMLRFLSFIRTIAWACYNDLVAQKMIRRRLQVLEDEEKEECDALDQFECLITEDIVKKILFGDDYPTTMEVKTLVLDILPALLQSPRIVKTILMGKSASGNKTSILDRITVFLNRVVSKTDDMADEIAFRHRIVNFYSYIVVSFDDGAKILLHDDEVDHVDSQEIRNILPNQLILLLRKELDELQSGESKHLQDKRKSLIQDLIHLLKVLGTKRKLKNAISFRHDLMSVSSNLKLRSEENAHDLSTYFSFDAEFLDQISANYSYLDEMNK